MKLYAMSLCADVERIREQAAQAVKLAENFPPAVRFALGQLLDEATRAVRVLEERIPEPAQEASNAPVTTLLDRDETIARIRKALRVRSGKAWSVTGGTGTAYGWVQIQAPPARRVEPYGYTSDADRAELGALLGMDGPVHTQGVSIPASSEYRQEYVDRAEGRAPAVTGTPYWD